MKRVPVWLQFTMLALAWGASFLFMKVGLEGLSAGQVVLGRCSVGAVTLAVIVAFTRAPLPKDATTWGHLLVVAILLCVAPFLLFSWAEQHVSSGLASIYNATTPLMTMLVATLALPSERLTRSRLTRSRLAGSSSASPVSSSSCRRGTVSPTRGCSGNSPASAPPSATAWGSPTCGAP